MAEHSTEEQITRGPRTFAGTTTRDALNQVRRSLGAEAIILRQVETAQGVEIEACLELPEDPQLKPEAPTQPEPQPAAPAATPVQPASAYQHAAPSDPHTAEVGEQWQEAGYSLPVLEDFAFCTSLPELRRQLAHRLDFAADICPGGLHSLRGVYRLVGAAGSGKTTLLVKILLEWVLHHSADEAAVVSTDLDRLGAGESLQLAAQMLNVDVLECQPRDLQGSLQTLAGKQLVLIDSPALQRHGQGAPPGVRDIWVLCGVHNLLNIKAQQALLPQPPAALALTHMDQLLCPDLWLNHIYRQRLPLLCLGTGRELSGALDLADAESVLRVLFPQVQTGVNHLTVSV